MGKTDLIKKTYRKLIWRKRTSEAKKLCAKHSDWEDLTSEERDQLRTKETYAYKIYKNLYPDWKNSELAYYISDAYYQTVVLPKLNKLNYDSIGFKHTESYFSDKNYEDLFMSGLRFPKTVFKNINGEFYDADFNMISEEKARELLSTHDRAVFKKSIFAGHGKGVQAAERGEYGALMNKFKTDYIVQEILEQNEATARFNESSVNIFRITTLLWKGKVYVLGIVLRVGAPGAFCDHLGMNGENPRVVGIREDGSLFDVCLDPDDGKLYKDLFGKSLDQTIPFIPKMISAVKDQHRKFPHHRIIGWDLAVDKNGDVVCIEYNSNVPGIVQSQMVLGPVFAQKTERGSALLDEILAEK